MNIETLVVSRCYAIYSIRETTQAAEDTGIDTFEGIINKYTNLT